MAPKSCRIRLERNPSGDRAEQSQSAEMRRQGFQVGRASTLSNKADLSQAVGRIIPLKMREGLLLVAILNRYPIRRVAERKDFFHHLQIVRDRSLQSCFLHKSGCEPRLGGRDPDY